MSDAIITVENLGKRYRIAHQQQGRRYVALRDVIAQKMKAPLHFLSRSQKSEVGSQNPPPDLRPPTSEDFWALKDVSFEVKRGEVVGIIGRNGAGKSTLLKILSRITEPTTGRVEIDGRVASLLEVGTGFHPELTGRENIYLNGAILGMRRAEIKRKFDEIVAFAEVEKFLDTPVKHYSSGMYVRLAFAVAAHLEPEILVVDEVLAVGDAEFQKKCLGKMGEVAHGGRTVLFVSHNMSAIQSLCGRGILLNQGSVKLDGNAYQCVQTYLQQHTGLDSFERPVDTGARVKIVAGKIMAAGGVENVRMLVNLQIWSDSARKVSVDLRLAESTGSPVGFGSLGTLDSNQLVNLLPGTNELQFSFSAMQLANGVYVVSLDVTIPFCEYLDRVERCLSFELARAVPAGNAHVASQRWGYGSAEIPLALAGSEMKSA